MATQRLDSANADARPGAADLSSSELLIATRNSSGQFAVCGAAGIPAGVIQEGKAAGLYSTVSTGPIVKVKAGAAVTAGTRVASDANGKAVAGTTNSIGVAITGASAEDEVIEVQWDPTTA